MRNNQKHSSNIAGSEIVTTINPGNGKDSATIRVVDYPHQLKKQQIKDLNELMNTVSKYERVLNSLSKITFRLFNEFLDSGQREDTKEARIYKDVLDIYHALIPASTEGTFNPYDEQLHGRYNADLKCFERYK